MHFEASKLRESSDFMRKILSSTSNYKLVLKVWRNSIIMVKVAHFVLSLITQRTITFTHDHEMIPNKNVPAHRNIMFLITGVFLLCFVYFFFAIPSTPRLFEPILQRTLLSKCQLQMALLIKKYFMIQNGYIIRTLTNFSDQCV